MPRGDISFHSIRDSGLARAWDDLADETAAPPFARHGWFLAWAEAFGRDVEVAVLGEGGPEALAPVLRHRGSITSPVNQETPQFGFVSASPEARDGLLRGLLDGGSVELLKVDRDHADALQRSAERHRVIENVMQRSPYLAIDRRWSEYESSITASFRQGLRRKARRLRDRGDVTIERHDDAGTIERLLQEGFSIESSRWKAERGTAIVSRPDTKAFYEAVSRWASERSWLRLWFLRFNEQALAFRLDLMAAGVYYHVKGGYDASHPGSSNSPGLLLQHDTVRFAFENGLSRYEFLGADENHKLRWTKTCRERLALRAYANNLRGTAGWLSRAVARPAVHRLTSVKTLARRP